MNSENKDLQKFVLINYCLMKEILVLRSVHTRPFQITMLFKALKTMNKMELPA